MLKTRRRAPDGIRERQYLAGEIYGPTTDPPAPAALAEDFLRRGEAERCGEEKIGQLAQSLPDAQALAAPPRVHAHEAPAGADAACVWCEAPYTARTGRGGPDQRFCSDPCRAAFHRGGRRWIARELEAGRLDIADLREA